MSLMCLVLAGSPVSARWLFENRSAAVLVQAEPRDSLTSLTLEQLHIPRSGPLTLSVSAGSNTIGGVTLAVHDPADEKARCELYASSHPDGSLRISDNRCSFSVFSGSLRTTAICRKISGQAHLRADGTVALELSSPDCSAQPLGLPLNLSGLLSPR